MVTWHKFYWFGLEINWQDISFYDQKALYKRCEMITWPGILLSFHHDGYLVIQEYDENRKVSDIEIPEYD